MLKTIKSIKQRICAKSLVTKLGEELVLVEVPVLVPVSLFNELQNVIVTDVYVQILVENGLDVVKSDQSSFLSIEQSKQVKSLFFPAFAEKPFFGNHFNDFTQSKWFLVFVLIADLVFDLFSVHFCEGEIAQYRSQLDSSNVIVAACIKCESVFDLVLHVFRKLTINILFALDVSDVFLHFLVDRLLLFLYFISISFYSNYYLSVRKLYYFYFVFNLTKLNEIIKRSEI